MPTAAVKVAYAGAAFDEHSMELRTYAASLIDLANAYSRAAVILFPGDPVPSINIRANREGSFWVDLFLSDPSGFMQQTIDLFSGRHATAATNLMTLAESVPAAMRARAWLRGRKPEVAPAGDGNVTVHVEGDNNNVIVVPPTAMPLVSDRVFARSAAAALEPIEDEPGATMEISAGTEVAVLRTGDQEAISAGLPGDDTGAINSYLAKMILPVAKAVLEGTGQWTFKYDGKQVQIPIADEHFLTHLDQVQITRGTRLVCQVETTELDVPGKDEPQVKRRIVEVLGTQLPGTQAKLFDF
ncbi:MAG: hypothetical protein ACOYEV_18010 [Candidatus Nanopelagicales bacterium]